MQLPTPDVTNAEGWGITILKRARTAKMVGGKARRRVCWERLGRKVKPMLTPAGPSVNRMGG